MQPFDFLINDLQVALIVDLAHRTSSATVDNRHKNTLISNTFQPDQKFVKNETQYPTRTNQELLAVADSHSQRVKAYVCNWLGKVREVTRLPN